MNIPFKNIYKDNHFQVDYLMKKMCKMISRQHSFIFSRPLIHILRFRRPESTQLPTRSPWHLRQLLHFRRKSFIWAASFLYLMMYLISERDFHTVRLLHLSPPDSLISETRPQAFDAPHHMFFTEKGSSRVQGRSLTHQPGRRLRRFIHIPSAGFTTGLHSLRSGRVMHLRSKSPVCAPWPCNAEQVVS